MKRNAPQLERRLSEAEECADTFDLHNGLGFLARIVETRVKNLYEELTGQSEITPRQFGVLLTLHQRGTMTLTDLAERICVDRSTLSEMIARMALKKVVTKSVNGADARSATVSLAPAGKTVLLEIILGVMEQRQALLAPVPKAERAQFIKNMKLVAGQPIRDTSDVRSNRRRRA
jgi:DNA-binding MarR family transcriptional regulator